MEITKDRSMEIHLCNMLRVEKILYTFQGWRGLQHRVKHNVQGNFKEFGGVSNILILGFSTGT